MIEKFIKIGTTGLVEQTATTQSAGAGDAGKIVALHSDGKLHQSLLPTGVGSETVVAIAGENLSAGNLVNFYNDNGALRVRKADASGGISKQVDGFVKDAVSQGQSATVYLEGVVSGLSGLTIGARYFLSASVPGGITTTIPTTSGHIMQYVGKAISVTELQFYCGEPIVRS